MSKNFLIAVIAATSMLLLSGKVVPADVYTGLQYNPQNNSLSGMSYTSLHYGEIENEYWCVQWDWEVCTHIHLYFPGTATLGALYGPSGLNQTHSAQSENGGAGSGVGYSEWYPQAGQWTAIGNHYVIVDVYYCSVWYDQQWGGYILDQCYYQWSEGGYSLGTTSAQATVGCTAANSPASFDQFATLRAMEWPIQEPYERGVTMECLDPNAFLFTYFNDSLGIHYQGFPPGPTMDPCASKIANLQGNPARAGLHSHPWFTTAEQFREGDGCWGLGHLYPSQSELQEYNIANMNFSDEGDEGDIPAFRCLINPLYLRTSDGTSIKKLQGTPGTGQCPFQVSGVSP